MVNNGNSGAAVYVIEPDIGSTLDICRMTGTKRVDWDDVAVLLRHCWLLLPVRCERGTDTLSCDVLLSWSLTDSERDGVRTDRCGDVVDTPRYARLLILCASVFMRA